MRGTRKQLVLVTRKEVRALGLRCADKSLGERTVHGQKHVFARVSPSQLRALCEHSGRRKGVKVKVGGKSVRAFPPGANAALQSRLGFQELRNARSASRRELKMLEEALSNARIQEEDDFGGDKGLYYSPKLQQDINRRMAGFTGATIGSRGRWVRDSLAGRGLEGPTMRER
jgi:hypothetical protein